jgi:molybdopterin-containing oxidoreductase family iron-sulfur binding subunit
MVPGLSPPSRKVYPSSGANGVAVQTDELLDMSQMNRPDISRIDSDPDDAKSPRFWRTLEELTNEPEFRELIENEFVSQEASGSSPIDRREFFTVMSVFLKLAGLTTLPGCIATAPEAIVPYVRQPEEIVPGKPLFFATAMPSRGYALGLLGESHMGRPTKVEGNPQHPDSLGATDAFAQASVLSLYDPDRAQVITHVGRISTWDAFITELATELEAQRLNDGRGLRVLSESVTSPTVAWQMRQLLTAFPGARWYSYEPVNVDNARVGLQVALGRYVDALYNIAEADVIVSFDADFLSLSPGHLRYTREFAGRRDASGERGMNRLYVLEATPSLTGAKSDHRLPVKSSDIRDIASFFASRLTGSGTSTLQPGVDSVWIDRALGDLQAHRGSSLIIAGDGQPPEVHALVHTMNAALGNVGRTVEYIDPVEANPASHLESLRELSLEMESGAVDLLLILSGNPVYTAPSDFEFDRRLNNVRVRIHLSSYDNETTELCHWHIPESHFLESWGDLRASNGAATIQQPLINPLYATKSVYEILSAFLNQPTRSAYEILREYWRGNRDEDAFERSWLKAVHDGIVEKDFGFRIADFGLRENVRVQSQSEIQNPKSDIEVVFRPDPTIFDGRFSNNAWLQELPKPLTRLTWDNPALLSPATGGRLGLTNGDVIEIVREGRSVRAPVWISPGHADDSITLFLGYGRTRTGRVGTGRGYNAYVVRSSNAMWTALDAEVRKTGERYSLVSTQEHQLVENRDLIRSGTPDHFTQHATPHEQISLYPEVESENYAWGMTIDLSACTGCNACVIACQAENNVPSVGKDQVANSREMHWLRIDTYYGGNAGNPEVVFQPMLCMHCEAAPCEPVCPVGATTHSAEGLNEMTYNRCVGTRYCSNNCPYKVRRFNFFQYANWDVPSLKLLANPDVTVRSRGVMEKCTYCVQRINHARIEAKKQNRTIRDGEVITACQAVCPAEAIVFGDTHDPNSRVSQVKADPRNYGLLAELNTRPRTTYLARLRNPNPELKG